jgi:hypothetical protein
MVLSTLPPFIHPQGDFLICLYFSFSFICLSFYHFPHIQFSSFPAENLEYFDLIMQYREHLAKFGCFFPDESVTLSHKHTDKLPKKILEGIEQ